MSVFVRLEIKWDGSLRELNYSFRGPDWREWEGENWVYSHDNVYTFYHPECCLNDFAGKLYELCRQYDACHGFKVLETNNYYNKVALALIEEYGYE